MRGIQRVEMHLERDAFTVHYDPARVRVAAMLEKIRSLGYRPHEISAARPPDGPRTAPTKPLPELVATALATAVAADELLLLDFYAAWCAPCRVLEKSVFTHSGVQRALEPFRLLKVDTDRHPEVAEYFGIKALPTLMVLDKTAAGRYRHMGMIAADDLARELAEVSKSQQGRGAR